MVVNYKDNSAHPSLIYNSKKVMQIVVDLDVKRKFCGEVEH